MKSSSTTSTTDHGRTSARPPAHRVALQTAPTPSRTVPRRRAWQTRRVRASPKPRVAPGPGLGGEAPLEDPLLEAGLHPLTAVPDDDDHVRTPPRGRPPRPSRAAVGLARVHDGVEGVVDQVAHHGGQVDREVVVDPAEPGPVGEPQADPPLGGQAGLGHEQRRQRGSCTREATSSSRAARPR